MQCNMSYNDFKRAGVFTRGNVLHEAGRFLKSFKPRFLDIVVMQLFF